MALLLEGMSPMARGPLTLRLVDQQLLPATLRPHDRTVKNETVSSCGLRATRLLPARRESPRSLRGRIQRQRRMGGLERWPPPVLTPCPPLPSPAHQPGGGDAIRIDLPEEGEEILREH